MPPLPSSPVHLDSWSILSCQNFVSSLFYFFLSFSLSSVLNGGISQSMTVLISCLDHFCKPVSVAIPSTCHYTPSKSHECHGKLSSVLSTWSTIITCFYPCLHCAEVYFCAFALCAVVSGPPEHHYIFMKKWIVSVKCCNSFGKDTQ